MLRSLWDDVRSKRGSRCSNSISKLRVSEFGSAISSPTTRDDLKPRGLGRPSYLHIGVPPAQTVSLLLNEHRYLQGGALLIFTCPGRPLDDQSWE